MDLASSLKYNKREKPRTVDSIDRIPRKKRKQTNKNIGYLCYGGGSDSDHDNHSFFFFERKRNTKSHRSGDSNFVKMKCVSNRLWAVRRLSRSHQVFNYEGLRFAVWISIAMCVCVLTCTFCFQLQCIRSRSLRLNQKWTLNCAKKANATITSAKQIKKWITEQQ